MYAKSHLVCGGTCATDSHRNGTDCVGAALASIKSFDLSISDSSRTSMLNNLGAMISLMQSVLVTIAQHRCLANARGGTAGHGGTDTGACSLNDEVNGLMQKEMVGSRKQRRLAQGTSRHQDNGTPCAKFYGVKDDSCCNRNRPESLYGARTSSSSCGSLQRMFAA